MITMGCDIGALFTKIVLLDGDKLVSAQVTPTMKAMNIEMERLIESVLVEADVERHQIKTIGATGSGAKKTTWAHFVEEELTCVAAAVTYYLPSVDLAIHVGGQSSAAVQIGSEGEVTSFARNDKCASGTGRFIDMMGRRLGVDLEEIDALALQATRPISISAQCAVFAESEVITHINNGESIAEICAGICASIGRMVSALARRYSSAKSFTLTGGVARFNTIADLLAKKLALPFIPFPEDPMLVTALGAALLEEVEEDDSL